MLRDQGEKQVGKTSAAQPFEQFGQAAAQDSALAPKPACRFVGSRNDAASFAHGGDGFANSICYHLRMLDEIGCGTGTDCGFGYKVRAGKSHADGRERRA